MAAAEIKAKARELGFADVRITSADDVPGLAEDLALFLAEGRHGEMGWMANTADRRPSPRAQWQPAVSLILIGDNYGPGTIARNPPDRAEISVYARGRDYHDSMKKRLKQLGRWLVETQGGDARSFVDTAPVMEKPLAARAGIGWQGRHTNLVSRRFGSWLFLGGLFTTLDLPPDPPEADHCGRCIACETACPTAALQDGRIDPRRCISYLTIEHKSEIDPALLPLFGNRIYGCDDCLAICPWNKFAQPTAIPDYAPRPELLSPALDDMARLDDAAFRAMFSGSPIKRIGRERFVRNVLIAIGNSGRKDWLGLVESLRSDEAPLVRWAANWAHSRLQ